MTVPYLDAGSQLVVKQKLVEADLMALAQVCENVCVCVWM